MLGFDPSAYDVKWPATNLISYIIGETVDVAIEFTPCTVSCFNWKETSVIVLWTKISLDLM